MNLHIDTQWMDLYLDGEMSAAQHRQAETHLAGCPACRAALERRRALSGLLLSAPPAPQGKTAERFAAEIERQMQNAPAQAAAPGHPWLRAAWVAVPLALLGVLVFFQAASLLTNLVAFIPGLSDALTTALAPSLALPGPLDGLRELAGLFAPISFTLITALAAPIAFGLLYLSWLAGWWAMQQAPRADFVQ